MNNLIILSGQSNALGVPTTGEGIMPRMKSVDDAQILGANGFEPLTFKGSDTTSVYGMEYGFAKVWTKRHGPVSIVKTGWNGAGMNKGFNPTDPGHLFVSLIRDIDRALSLGTYRPVGLIWCQGEADAKSDNDSRAYADLFAEFAKSIRSVTQTPNLPILCPLLGCPIKRFPYIGRINDVFMNNAKNHVFPVPTSGLKKQGDGVHYRPHGLFNLGHAAGKLMSDVSRKK